MLTLSSMNARNGAIPVPGPTIIMSFDPFSGITKSLVGCMYIGTSVSFTAIPLAKSPVAKPYLSLSRLLYFTIATVKCISPK